MCNKCKEGKRKENKNFDELADYTTSSLQTIINQRHISLPTSIACGKQNTPFSIFNLKYHISNVSNRYKNFLRKGIVELRVDRKLAFWW